MRSRYLPTLAVAISIAACSDATSPELAAVGSDFAFQPVAAATTSGTVTYDFTTLPRLDPNSQVPTDPFAEGGALADGFEGLSFIAPPPFLYVRDFNGRWSLLPNDDEAELLIQLPATATSATLEYYGTGPSPWLRMTAYADDVSVGQTDVPGMGFDLATVQASAFNRIGIASSGKDGYFYYTLTVTYAGPGAPTRKADCTGGGWQTFGFRNQGQCIRFVETGKDSR